MTEPINELSLLTADCLKLARDVETFVLTSLHGTRVDEGDDLRVFQATQVSRSVQYFRSLLVLVGSGFSEPAGALLRVLLEQWFVLAAVIDHPERLRELSEQAVAENHKALNGLKGLPQEARPELMTAQAIEDLRQQMPTSKSGGFSAQYWAEKAGDLHTYHTMYRRLNTFSHGSLNSLGRYLVPSQNDQGGTIRIADMHKELSPQFLISASAILLGMVDALLQGRQVQSTFSSRIDGLNARSSSLIDGDLMLLPPNGKIEG